MKHQCYYYYSAFESQCYNQVTKFILYKNGDEICLEAYCEEHIFLYEYFFYEMKFLTEKEFEKLKLLI